MAKIKENFINVEYTEKPKSKKLKSNKLFIIILASLLVLGLIKVTLLSVNESNSTFESLRRFEYDNNLLIKRRKRKLQIPINSDHFNTAIETYISKAVNGAEDEIEYTETEVVSEIENELEKKMEDVELKMIEYLKLVFQNMIISVTEEETRDILQSAFQLLEEKELDKVKSVGKNAVEDAKNQIEEAVKSSSSISDIISNIDTIEKESENDVVERLGKKMDEIMNALDQDAKEIMNGAIEDFLEDRQHIEDSIEDAVVKKKVRTEMRNLWLLCCETRKDHDNLKFWTKSAESVKEMAAANNSGNIYVYVHNICEGKEWEGYNTKSKAMELFLKEMIDFGSGSDLVMFTDSDTIFNFRAVSAEEAVKRYDIAREGLDILISAESNCWVGRNCQKSDFSAFYPNATPSNCPQFLNSGQYMGPANALVKMYEGMHSIDIKKEYDLSSSSNQALMAAWYSKNSELAMLDAASVVFRNMMFGVIDSSAKGSYSCGPGKSCGEFDPPKSGAVDPLNLHIDMEDVPGCSAESKPFSIHGSSGKSNFLDFRSIIKEGE